VVTNVPVAPESRIAVGATVGGAIVGGTTTAGFNENGFSNLICEVVPPRQVFNQKQLVVLPAIMLSKVAEVW
jgi:hypothetical protein